LQPFTDELPGGEPVFSGQDAHDVAPDASA
jgi:hypothetical protein